MRFYRDYTVGDIKMKMKAALNGYEKQQSITTAIRSDEEDCISRYMEGMGTATARILIKRYLDESELEEYGLSQLYNTGRYYTARIVEADGRLIDEVLIDKQSGIIQSLRRKPRAIV
jgi:hypothetical protein